jgi:hypothetical protein
MDFGKSLVVILVKVLVVVLIKVLVITLRNGDNSCLIVLGSANKVLGE